MKKAVLFFILVAFVIYNLKSQSIVLTYPSGGEKFMKNIEAFHNIEWTYSGISNVKIEYSTDNANSWITIVDNYPANTGYYDWITPNVVSNQCIVKISDASNNSSFSQSSVFEIVEQQIFYAKWETSMGNFRAELRGDLVPITVQNFVNLANKNFYNNLIFHRVISNFMIQDGCPLGTGEGGPGYEFDNEIHPLLTHAFPGILSMANAGPNTNGSQYYITVDATTWLDGDYNIYGKIVDSMDVVYAISEVETDSYDKPLIDVDIYSVTIEDYNPILELTFPENGEALIENTDYEITWYSEFYADIKIEFSTDNGSTWELLEDSIAAYNQHFAWTTPSILSDECKIRISSLRNQNDYVENAIPFTIKNKPVTYLRFDGYENITPSVENPENLFMPGNKFKFKVQALNEYSETLTSLSAKLTTSSQYITILNEEVTFSSVNAGEKVWSEQEFEIQISTSIPGIAEYNFELTFEDAVVNDQPWINKFAIPLLSRGLFGVIDDDSNPDSNGNNNKIIEPGETAEIKITLQNTSNFSFYDTYGKLTTNQYFINIWNNQQGATEIVYDTTTYLNNPITPANMFTYQAHDFVFDYTEGYTFKIDFLLKVCTYINDYQGISYDEGGIKIMYGIPYILNSTYPEVNISELNSSSEFDFEIYPNPAKDIIEISIPEKISNYSVSVFDITGNIIYENSYKSVSGNLKINHEFASGTYIIKIIDNQYNSKSKLFIVN